jgi:hypothetical protein
MLLDFFTTLELTAFIPYLEQSIQCCIEEYERDTRKGGLKMGIEASKKLVLILKDVSTGAKTWERRVKYKKN